VLFDLSVPHEVINGGFGVSRSLILFNVAADSNIDHNLFVAVHMLSALLDSRGQVGIPHSTPIHEYFIIISSGWEDRRHGRRGQDDSRNLIMGPGLIISSVFSVSSVDSSNYKFLFNSAELCVDALEGFEEGCVIYNAFLIKEPIDKAIWPELPHIGSGQAHQGVYEELTHGSFFTDREQRNSSSVDGTS